VSRPLALQPYRRSASVIPPNRAVAAIINLTGCRHAIQPIGTSRPNAMTHLLHFLPLALLLGISLPAAAQPKPQPKPRARQLGVPLEGTPGPLNAITDVPGLQVGHRTLVAGDSVRTGVTAVWPRGQSTSDPVFGGFFSQNGNGDMTGTHWLEESGFLDGPVLITNTHSVGVVRDAYLAWLVKNQRKPGTNVFAGGFYTYPIVAETYDGFLNDINGFHVKPADVEAALVTATPVSSAVPEPATFGLLRSSLLLVAVRLRMRAL
jgi:hypothetical protein